MQKKYLYLLIFAILIIGIFIYTHASGNFYRGHNQQAPIAVSAQTISQRDVTVYLNTIGNVEAFTTVNIKSLVDGQIIKVGFIAGQTVQKDQLLFTIDPRPYQIALQQAQANLAKDQAQLLNAKLILQRFAKLIKQHYVAQQDYDQNHANVDALIATVKADEAAVANAQLQLNYCSITAPISGRAGDVLVKAGNLVKTAEGATLVTINQITPITISFTIPQQYLPIIQRQQALAPLPIIAHINKINKIEKGQLAFINNTIDTTTGTVQLKANFDNVAQLLWPGQFVKLTLPTAFIKHAVLAPTAAIQTGQKGTYVFIIRQDGKAYYQAVKTGPSVNEGTIIEQGLTVGDHVVVDGQFLLTNGTPVKIISKP